jgi:hypothetical protein
MYETEEQIQELQQLIDRSFENAGPHLLSIITPERRLSARQVVTYLQGTKHVAFATVTAKGEPRVAPLDGLFLWGRFYVGTDGGTAVRARHLETRRAVSLTHYIGDEIAVTVHGHAVVIEKEDEEAARIDEVWKTIYGMTAFDLAPRVIFMRVEPTHFFTFAMHPENYPESPPLFDRSS